MYLRARAWAIFRCGPCNAATLSRSWPLQVWKQKPIVTPAWLGPPPAQAHQHRIVRFLSCPPRKQPLDEAVAESLARDSGDVPGVELLQPSKAGRFFVDTASQEHSNSGAGSGREARPARSLSADLAGVSLPKSGGRTTTRHSSGEKVTQRRGKHKPIVLLSIEMVRS